jgi:hypothetical protein
MWIFIKGIPKGMDSKALERFIKRILSLGWLPFAVTGRVRVRGSKILKIVHTRTRSIEYHGLIQIQPASRAEGVIQRINQSKFNGRRLESHPYSKRFARADRRNMFMDERGRAASDRRQVERRRRNLVSQVVDSSL